MLLLRTRCVCRREIAFSNSIARRELNKLYKAKKVKVVLERICTKITSVC